MKPSIPNQTASNPSDGFPRRTGMSQLPSKIRRTILSGEAGRTRYLSTQVELAQS